MSEPSENIGLNRKRKILIAVNSTWNVVNFRAGLIRALVSLGYEVVAMAPSDKYAVHLSEIGCRFIPLSMDSNGTHPGRDLRTLMYIYRILKNERPNVFLGFTVKPNIYGSMAAHFLGIPVVNNIAGLGVAFLEEGWLNRVVALLYRIALFKAKRVFFQNGDDRALFIKRNLVSPARVDTLPGSGVDVSKFLPIPLPNNGSIRFLLIARMLWDKGVGDFVEAARILKHDGINAQFYLLGFLDSKNPHAISREQMNEWVTEGVVQYLGVSDRVQDEIALADCIVLPSFYREGTPKVLLEAAAMARPIVTTDSIGCREVVDDGINGFLCRPKNALDLAAKMKLVFSMSPQERAAMGRKGREKIMEEYDERIVIRKYLEIIAKVDGA